MCMIWSVVCVSVNGKVCGVCECDSVSGKVCGVCEW